MAHAGRVCYNGPRRPRRRLEFLSQRPFRPYVTYEKEDGCPSWSIPMAGCPEAAAAPESERAAGLERAKSLKRVPITSREVSDFLMLAMGAYTPLDGFMGHDDWRGACVDMRLATAPSGLFPSRFPANGPLPTRSATARKSRSWTRIRTTCWARSPSRRSTSSTGSWNATASSARSILVTPGVQKVVAQPEVNLAGPVVAFSESRYPQTYEGLYYRPGETRRLFRRKAGRGWRRSSNSQPHATAVTSFSPRSRSRSATAC